MREDKSASWQVAEGYDGQMMYDNLWSRHPDRELSALRRSRQRRLKQQEQGSAGSGHIRTALRTRDSDNDLTTSHGRGRGRAACGALP